MAQFSDRPTFRPSPITVRFPICLTLWLILLAAAFPQASENEPTPIKPSQLVLPCSIHDVWAGLEGGYNFLLKDTAGNELRIRHRDMRGASEPEFTVNKEVLNEGSPEETALLNALESAFPAYYDSALQKKVNTRLPLQPEEIQKSFRQESVARCLRRLRERVKTAPKQPIRQ